MTLTERRTNPVKRAMFDVVHAIEQCDGSWASRHWTARVVDAAYEAQFKFTAQSAKAAEGYEHAVVNQAEPMLSTRERNNELLRAAGVRPTPPEAQGEIAEIEKWLRGLPPSTSRLWTASTVANELGIALAHISTLLRLRSTPAPQVSEEALAKWFRDAGRFYPGVTKDATLRAMSSNDAALLLAALPGLGKGPSVPDGWKLVPVEPTREMWAASGDAIVKRQLGAAHHDQISEAVWKAMLGALPAPPREGGETE